MDDACPSLVRVPLDRVEAYEIFGGDDDDLLLPLISSNCLNCVLYIFVYTHTHKVQYDSDQNVCQILNFGYLYHYRISSPQQIKFFVENDVEWGCGFDLLHEFPYQTTYVLTKFIYLFIFHKGTN